jgi:hypothetical protein
VLQSNNNTSVQKRKEVIYFQVLQDQYDLPPN